MLTQMQERVARTVLSVVKSSPKLVALATELESRDPYGLLTEMAQFADANAIEARLRANPALVLIATELEDIGRRLEALRNWHGSLKNKRPWRGPNFEYWRVPESVRSLYGLVPPEALGGVAEQMTEAVQGRETNRQKFWQTLWMDLLGYGAGTVRFVVIAAAIAAMLWFLFQWAGTPATQHSKANIRSDGAIGTTRFVPTQDADGYPAGVEWAEHDYGRYPGPPSRPMGPSNAGRYKSSVPWAP